MRAPVLSGTMKYDFNAETLRRRGARPRSGIGSLRNTNCLPACAFALKSSCLGRNNAVALGSAVVSLAVFGVSPKTLAVPGSVPVGVGGILVRLSGETPAKATETVALPNPSESFRLREWIRFGLCLALLAGAGCVSQKKAHLEAQQAYAAGQQQAMQAAMQAQRQPKQGPVVFVQGQVRNPVVPWEEGMKVSQAIVAAEYTAFMNPRLVRVLRNGQVVGEIKGIDLLHHEDMDLEEGDTVLIVP
jgi:hypothetical protein